MGSNPIPSAILKCMPTARVNDINMYYEIRGDGEPLVLIPGLSNDISDYERIIPLLAVKYKVIALDNRGAGRTDKPDIPYSIEMMADDTAGLLNALAIKQAHVLGVSMGGRIAAALTLQHPEFVKTLILVSTIVKQQVRFTWTSRFLLNLALWIPMLRGSRKYPQPKYAFVRQRQASRSYGCMDRLHEIRVPTLILHGRKDKLAPYKLAEEMHAGIQGSKMITFNAGHLFLFFRPQQFVDAIAAFLNTRGS